MGADILGYAASEVPSLAFYARRRGRSTALADVEVRGEDPAGHRSRVEYDWEWTEDGTGPVGFLRRGIRGLVVRKYDDSLCTGCSAVYNPMLVMLMSAFRGEPFPGIEVVSGKRQLASAGFAKTVLFGKCACQRNRDNPDIAEAIPVPGCPPDLGRFVRAMRDAGIPCDYADYVAYRRHLYDRYRDREEFDLSLYYLG